MSREIIKECVYCGQRLIVQNNYVKVFCDKTCENNYDYSLKELIRERN